MVIEMGKNFKSGRLTSAIASDETDIHTLRRVKGVDLVKTICGLGVKPPLTRPMYIN